MRNTCINHPINEPLLLIRQWQLDATEDHCAAALLSFFEYWHNIKSATMAQTQHKHKVQEQHGETPDDVEITVMQWHTEKDLQQGILGLYGKSTIKHAINILVRLGFISVHANPNEKYKFDKTRHFIFHPKAVNKWLESTLPETSAPCIENSSPQAESSAQQAKNSSTSPEITSEITPEKKEREERAREDLSSEENADRDMQILDPLEQVPNHGDPLPDACLAYHDTIFPCPHEQAAMLGLPDILGRPVKKSHRHLHAFVHAHSLIDTLDVARHFVTHEADRTKWTLGLIYAPDNAEARLQAARMPEPQEKRRDDLSRYDTPRTYRFQDDGPQDPGDRLSREEIRALTGGLAKKFNMGDD